MTRFRRRLVFWSLCIAIALVPSAHADTFSWKDPVDGNWNDGSRWTNTSCTTRCRSYPGAGGVTTDTAQITVNDPLAPSFATYTVTLNVSVTLGSLTVGGAADTRKFHTQGMRIPLSLAPAPVVTLTLN
ncbi:MAG TPA: hypothetical protein VFL80_12610, partial [Thermoanaerobaculia bacterium]|nr:hypothetical protein [Thermoanaerobaculia bacterium]